MKRIIIFLLIALIAPIINRWGTWRMKIHVRRQRDYDEDIGTPATWRDYRRQQLEADKK